ncbi:LacI family transcriptional regulator [Metabacillus idriensis]|uniref:Substrate-binding domain-containing protein n=1 Tax=Metabacillus idriensis TaxID=324768 RepID=A0A6I2M8M2_9BACI|nr:LacI family DNA-binding transcriptional regulator [Metabacillus idriensis]MCM3598620.1 LacI family transcriptional regulator [Metabacillus idriensis]MRX54458.1 substrate-binding domain-containing protein [Metabacillus idriensis]OHR65847.1 LacI family transcriptional regulator [Bacillus sp. HMSC76G11]
MTTIKDIAKAAGVSVTTVSRALNGYSDVNEKTRQKISRIAKELNYSPNTLARGLVMKKSKTIGMLVSGMDRVSSKDNFTFEVLSGVNECISERDYDLVLFSTTTTKQREKTYSQLCRERRVDGAILQGMKIDDPYLKEVVESDIPCMLIDIPIASNSVGYVTTDNVLGAKRAVEHLISLGHTKIALINGHDQAYVSKQRLKGYLDALMEAKLEVNEDWIVSGDFSEEKAELVTEKLLREHPEITAVFCASDLMALGAMKSAKASGTPVPEGLSVIGYDNILLAAYSNPALTTMAQNKFELGYQAANSLIDMLEGKSGSNVITLKTDLIIRESTKKNHKP